MPLRKRPISVQTLVSVLILAFVIQLSFGSEMHGEEPLQQQLQEQQTPTTLITSTTTTSTSTTSSTTSSTNVTEPTNPLSSATAEVIVIQPPMSIPLPVAARIETILANPNNPDSLEDGYYTLGYDANDRLLYRTFRQKYSIPGNPQNVSHAIQGFEPVSFSNVSKKTDVDKYIITFYGQRPDESWGVIDVKGWRIENTKGTGTNYSSRKYEEFRYFLKNGKEMSSLFKDIEELNCTSTIGGRTIVTAVDLTSTFSPEGAGRRKGSEFQTITEVLTNQNIRTARTVEHSRGYDGTDLPPSTIGRITNEVDTLLNDTSRIVGRRTYTFSEIINKDTEDSEVTETSDEQSWSTTGVRVLLTDERKYQYFVNDIEDTNKYFRRRTQFTPQGSPLLFYAQLGNGISPTMLRITWSGGIHVEINGQNITNFTSAEMQRTVNLYKQIRQKETDLFGQYRSYPALWPSTMSSYPA